MAPEKENPRAHMAMSALARALHNTKKACIIRFVPRANQAVFVGCATPLLGDNNKPDCLVLNYLPFTGTLPTSDTCKGQECYLLVLHRCDSLVTKTRLFKLPRSNSLGLQISAWRHWVMCIHLLQPC